MHKPTKSTSKADLMLPRGYISWSAMESFRRDPERYKRHYFFGEETGIETPALSFGKSFAETLGKRRGNADPVIDLAMRMIPRLPVPEARIEAFLPSPRGRIKLCGAIDRYDPKTHDFIEYKTGTHHWTARKANMHGQMKFYQLMIWLNHGTMANEKRLVWVETKNGGDEITITGKVKIFPVHISMHELLRFAETVRRTAFEISELYQEVIAQSV